MSRQPTVSDDSVPNRSSVAASAGVGVLAAAVGYLLTYLLIGSEVRNAAGDVAEWKGVAWYFYNAHRVHLEVTGPVGPFGGTGTANLNLITESSSANADLLYVVPPLALIGAGALLAYQLRVTDLDEAVAAGAPVTIGYAVVLGLGTLVAEASGTLAVGIRIIGSIAPATVPAIVLGGVLYPLVFATAGAVLGAPLASR